MASCEFYSRLKLYCSSLSVVLSLSLSLSLPHTHTRFMASVIKLIPCYEFPDPLKLSAHIKVLLAREKDRWGWQPKKRPKNYSPNYLIFSWGFFSAFGLLYVCYSLAPGCTQLWFSSLTLCRVVCEHPRTYVCRAGCEKRRQCRVTDGYPLLCHGSRP